MDNLKLPIKDNPLVNKIYVWGDWKEVSPGVIERRGYVDLYPPGYTHKKRKRKVNRYKK